MKRIVRSIALVTIAATTLVLSPWISNDTIAGGTEQQVCDVRADYFLGVEDYPEAIRRHVDVVRKNPNNALAHYHLGIALGMVGDSTAEAKEYQLAAALGFRSWDFFLNLGLAQVENGDLVGATESLRRAVSLGAYHSESHFNLTLVDDRRGMLTDAEFETMASLRLNPEQPDARNLLGAIYAQEGRAASASLVWRQLVHDLPDYEPARANLAILGNSSEVAAGETAAADLPRAAAGNTVENEDELRATAGEMPSP